MHLSYPHVSHLWIYWFEEMIRDEIQWQNLLKFTHIEKVELTYWCASEELTNILSAPHLQKVTFVGDYFNVKDLQMLKSSVIEKKVLRKLKSLIIQMKINSWSRLTDVEHFKELMELIKCAAGSLPQLTHLKFYLNYRPSEYSIVARSLRDGKTDTGELPDVSAFFRNMQNDDIAEDSFSWYVDEELISILDDFR
ncbi:Hypothetical predicted protein [Cloeon dipterum]|uniref:Uncharacterized protein n=1 Tax=Cloeon dipterum TaxID=197152 RepID=A0A8S1CFB1_9INSE|nr:Hypothetical predicted protein [Cloeon dipterum]